MREETGAQADAAGPDRERVCHEDRNIDAHEPHVGQVVDRALVPEHEAEIPVRGGVAAFLQAYDALDFNHQAPGHVVIDETAELDAESGIGGQAGLSEIHILACVIGLQQHTEADGLDFQGVGILGAQGREAEGRGEDEEYDFFHGGVS